MQAKQVYSHRRSVLAPKHNTDLSRLINEDIPRPSGMVTPAGGKHMSHSVVRTQRHPGPQLGTSVGQGAPPGMAHKPIKATQQPTKELRVKQTMLIQQDLLPPSSTHSGRQATSPGKFHSATKSAQSRNLSMSPTPVAASPPPGMQVHEEAPSQEAGGNESPQRRSIAIPGVLTPRARGSRP